MLSKPKVKYIQTLGQKKFREEERLFIAEGPKLVKELLEAGNTSVSEVYALPDWISEHQNLLDGVTCIEITPPDLERISQLTTPNKVLALVKQFDNTPAAAAKGIITLALDNIQDPGNLGTIVRIADWFGISQVVCTDNTADIYNPKVVQSTMGSIARVRVGYTHLAQWLKEQTGMRIYAATLDGQDIRSMKKIEEGILVIGNEAKGISPEILQLATEMISIPKKGDAESLNAAVATGIIVSHLT
ncbi:MAG: RNA methyltransferase [Chitinophagaceae bacterium]